MADLLMFIISENVQNCLKGQSVKHETSVKVIFLSARVVKCLYKSCHLLCLE